jgi:hypothetical protein
LVFPEVFERLGFDAVIGNPPFLGGSRISVALGSAYREFLLEHVSSGFGAGGRGDLVAYFLLRAVGLLCKEGQLGLVSSNTLTQGDTRELGLDRMGEKGFAIRSGIKSQP